MTLEVDAARLRHPIMRRIALLTFIISLLSLSGCTVPEALFSVLGDYYSGGGTTRAEKKYHFDGEIEKWQSYEQYGAP
jgi:hypothetical protein